jgi:hypothetical protein
LFPGSLEQLLDALGLGRAQIGFKVELREPEQPEPAGQLPPQKVPRPFQRFQGIAAAVVIADKVHPDPGVAHVRRDNNFSYVNTLDPGIGQLIADDLGEFLADCLGNAFRTMLLHFALLQPLNLRSHELASQKQRRLLLY